MAGQCSRNALVPGLRLRLQSTRTCPDGHATLAAIKQGAEAAQASISESGVCCRVSAFGDLTNGIRLGVLSL